MSVNKSNLIVIAITDEMNHVAEYVAEKRSLFEYPRRGYGSYEKISHINKIKTGILGELAFLEYIFSYLNNNFGAIEPLDRWQILHKRVEFSYGIVIGKFDEGFEFKIKNKTIDIKTYENNKVSLDQIFKGLKLNGMPLNLLIDQKQNSKADFYVQAFLLDDDKSVCLAGYSIGLPPLASWMPNPAYTKAVPDLEPMSEILKEFIINA
ncbi:MAG: hypothetical protein ABI643_01555 [Candidatus Doudnabacteria bacterium]